MLLLSSSTSTAKWPLETKETAHQVLQRVSNKNQNHAVFVWTRRRPETNACYSMVKKAENVMNSLKNIKFV